MPRLPVIAIYDVGKTNKKFFLYNEDYDIVFQKILSFPQRLDEDGYECENLDIIESFLFETIKEIQGSGDFVIKAINFSTYGASMVHVDENGIPLVDMFNYLKPYPEELKKLFLSIIGNRTLFELETSCSLQGNLNTGLQLFRIKENRKELWTKIKYSLHFPQYLSSRISKKYYSDITSIGCHTSLWNFEKRAWHPWIMSNGIQSKLPDVYKSSICFPTELNGEICKVGIGIHDSSSALVPYLKTINKPFILLSTGTWSIALNPFSTAQLTKSELDNGCLSYLSFEGRSVKASRVFLGNIYNKGLEKITKYFNTSSEKYTSLKFNPVYLKDTIYKMHGKHSDILLESFDFMDKDLAQYLNDEEAYYDLVWEILHVQQYYINIIDPNEEIKYLYVDGGFGKNEIFMHLIASVFPKKNVFAAEIPQSTALGAALVLHEAWNKNKNIPKDLIKVVPY